MVLSNVFNHAQTCGLSLESVSDPLSLMWALSVLVLCPPTRGCIVRGSVRDGCLVPDDFYLPLLNDIQQIKIV